MTNIAYKTWMDLNVEHQLAYEKLCDQEDELGLLAEKMHHARATLDSIAISNPCPLCKANPGFFCGVLNNVHAARLLFLA